MGSISMVDSRAVLDVKADSDTLLNRVDFLRIDASIRLDRFIGRKWD
ncbi:MAG: hypothetical protein ABR985_13515 [Methanotrichaceae archaeon]